MKIIKAIVAVWEGFNRYMVECECATEKRWNVDEPRFNRYMVECECL